MRKHSLSEYFYFTRMERNATIVLAVLCLFFLFLPMTFPLLMPPEPEVDFEPFRKIIAAATAPVDDEDAAASAPNFRNETEAPTRVELFHFDPNTASKEELMRLGLSARTAQTMLNYRSKGGQFRKKEDLGKLYGLRQEDYQRLLPWVSITATTPGTKWTEPKTALETQGVEVAEFRQPPPVFERKKWEPTPIDFNAATAEEWQQLKGIGPGYSRRIVNFREKLGGFISAEQVAETFGLPDSTFQAILPYLQGSGSVFRKLKVNSATLEELKMHPYLSSFQATVIFNYHTQHGDFKDMESLRKVKAGFKEEDWTKLEPYLSFE